ncbi:MAG: DUF2660 domain-containing protein [Rickettsiaceae bacterium]|nr:DUF2660 domain-containing protein [Rickettsiaceae bacterium]
MFAFIIITIILLVILFLLYWKFTNRFAVKHVVPKDPKAQALYEQQKKETSEDKSLSLQERIELSWQFPKNVKNHVLNKFSKTDQEKVKKAGEKLTEYGMKYEHDVDLTVKQLKGKSHTKAVSKDKKASKTMAR